MRSILFHSIILFFALTGCGKKQEASVHNHTVMPVQKVMADSVVMLNTTQIRLANITTQKVMLGKIGQTVALNARLMIDENKSKVVSSRVAGRIEKLFVKETGRSIRKGEPLYTLYSETLLTLQREYLLAKEQYETLGKNQPRYQQYFESAEKKLALYGLSQKQIAQLAQSKSVQQSITFLSPVDGIVTGIDAAEGQYVTEGGALYRLEDLSQLWLEAELYPQETSLVKTGDLITARIGGDKNNTIEAKVIFMSPEYRPNSQVTIFRAEIKNNDLKWKPGMQAQVFLTHSSHQAITIPIEGVIRSEQGAQLFVLSDANTFQSREVKTGLEDFRQIEITGGLKEGETVVISGAYLLYSEFILKH